MATTAIPTMANKKHKTVDITNIPQPTEERRPEECEYGSVKIDKELFALIRRAAAELEIPLQEFMSDALNLVASAVLSREPIKRRTPPARGRP